MSILWLIWPWLVLDSFLRFGLLLLRALRPAAPVWPEIEEANGCVVLIAAHEEAGTIGPTVAALKSHLREWPGSRLWVVADRCHDSTAAEAASTGAEVARRSSGRLGKGAVIAWWLANRPNDWRDNEVIVVLDADSRLGQGSLRALRRAMASGADAAQAFIAPDASTRSGRLAGWSEVLMQRIDDEARRRCNWPVPLRGTGMALRASLLAELAPRLHTLAEDLELDVMLAARGARVLFAPEAVVFDPKPAHAAGASRQRARWLQGQLQVLRDYWREFLQALWARGPGAWFLLWLLMLRPKTLFIGLRLVMLIITLGWGPWRLALAALILDMIYYIAGVSIVDDRRRYLLDLLAAPRYVAMWLFSFGTAIVRRGWLKAGR
jgi:cellulose synthase/poly-beta-1,6-N-acetylglucosamine synthase-like glycosyltransferase